MSKELIRSKAQGILANAGRAALHALAPNDFEYYACIFQLVDYSGDIEQIFNFPVSPTSIQVARNAHVSIKKTESGYVETFSPSYVGKTISISGTFGRKFRLLVSRDNNPTQTKEKKKERNEYYKKDTFDANVKTGFGALKLLEKIVARSTDFCEAGFPMRLYFYNLQANESYWVEVMSFSKNMSMENNAMWNWNIEMKAIAPVPDTYSGKSKIGNLLAMAAVQKSLNQTFSNLTVGGVTRKNGIIGG